MFKRHSWNCQAATTLSSFSGVHCSTLGSISAMLEKTLAHVTLTTLRNWFKRALTPTNCLGPPHSSRQGPTRFWDLALSDIALKAPMFSEVAPLLSGGG